MAIGKRAFAQKMTEAGVCDARGAAFCATAAGLPGGEFGMCLLGVNGNALSIYDTNMKSEVGRLLYRIELKDASDLSISNGLWGELLKGYSFRFTVGGFVYTFKNCYAQKQALAVIAEEIAK